jgi:antitoxin component YwqK of YwqJK toxin-antitoxin module
MIIASCIPMLKAQELTDTHINKVDLQGRRQGLWRVYDGDEGYLKFTGEFQNDKPVGEFLYFFPNGKTKAIILQLDSGRISYATNFYLNGNIMAKGKYINQKKDSTWLYYNEEDATLASEEYYASGSKEGVWKVYYPEGGVAEEITYQNNLRHGPWMLYFTDGKLKLKATYVDDKLEGQYDIYHLNGKVEVSGTFLHDNKHGTWVYLSEIGELEKREEYVNGKMEEQEILKQEE